jgi:hypothetical protein
MTQEILGGLDKLLGASGVFGGGLEGSPKPTVKVIPPPTSLDPVIEQLLNNSGLGWLIPTITKMLEIESGNNPYLVVTGKTYTKRVEKLLPQLEAKTGAVWSLNPYGESPTANEFSVGTWQYNLHIGEGQQFFIDNGTPIGTPDTLTDDQLVEAISALSDNVGVSLHAINKIAGNADYLIGKGLDPKTVAKQVLWPWAAKNKAIAEAPPTSFSQTEQVTEVSIIPKREDYINDIGEFDSEGYITDVKYVADLLAITGGSLPEGTDDYFKLNYDAAKVLYKGVVPTAEDTEKARLELEQLKQALAINAQTLAKGEQDYRLGEQEFRLGEPIGIEAALRSASGQQGYKDYWSGRPINSAYQDDSDYMTAYNYGVAEERPDLLTGQAAGMDRIIDYIGQSIESRKLRTSQVVEEFNRNMAAFAEGGKQYLGGLQYAYQPRNGYIPGREPGGLGQTLGLPNVKAQPYLFDPFQMSLDLLKNTQPITSVGTPPATELPANAFSDALAIYNKLLGR